MQQQIKNKLVEISKIKGLDKYDISDLFKKAIKQEIQNKNNFVYMGKNLKINDNLSLNDNVDLNINHLLKIFGSFEDYKKFSLFNDLGNYLRYSDPNTEFMKNNPKYKATTLKDNTILNFKTYNLYNGFISFVDSFYNLYEFIINKRYLNDRKEINDYINNNNLKENAYLKSGELTIKDLNFKLFLNGRVDITFKNKEIAKAFFEEFKRLNKLKYSYNDWRH